MPTSNEEPRVTLREKARRLLSQAQTLKPSPALALLGVWFAIGLHAIWASLLLFSSEPEQTTAIYTLSRLFPNQYGLAIVLITVASCALYGLFKKGGNITDRVLLLAPQQILLGISAAGAVRAMALGEFADGTVRSSAFLIADQAPAVLALFVHSGSIVYLALVRPWK
jgi:hypothetical protein